MPHPNPIAVHMTFEPSDVVHAYQLHSRDQLWRRRSLVSLTLTFAAMAAFILGTVPDRKADAVILAMALFGGLVAPRLAIRWLTPRTARRIFAQQQALHDPMDVVFDADALRTSTATGSSTTPWTRCRRLLENQHIMLFYQSDALFQFVPKRLLPGTKVDDVRRLYMESRIRASDAKAAVPQRT